MLGDGTSIIRTAISDKHPAYQNTRMTIPRISVVMPVWNGEKYLREAIDSLLAQSFGDFELLVMDDGSTDGTSEILHSYRDSRIRPIRLDHGGIIAAERRGVAQARADWIGRQDADDASEPTRLQKQWTVLSRRPDAVFCYTNVRRIGEISQDPPPGHFPTSRALLAMRLCWQNPFTHSTVVYRKQAFLEAGQYDQRDYPADDYALWGRMFELGEFVGISEPLVVYRVLGTSVSRANAGWVGEEARRIAVEHCCRFMRLSPADSRRAFEILITPRELLPWRDWQWFLRRCVPGLRWKSAELYAWLGWQTVKTLFFPTQNRP